MIVCLITHLFHSSSFNLGGVCLQCLNAWHHGPNGVISWESLTLLSSVSGVWVISASWLTHLCRVIHTFLSLCVSQSLSQRIPALTAEWDAMTSPLCHSCCVSLKAQWQHLLRSMETVAAMSCESQVCYWSPFSAGVSEWWSECQCKLPVPRQSKHQLYFANFSEQSPEVLNFWHEWYAILCSLCYCFPKKS